MSVKLLSTRVSRPLKKGAQGRKNETRQGNKDHECRDIFLLGGRADRLRLGPILTISGVLKARAKRKMRVLTRPGGTNKNAT